MRSDDTARGEWRFLLLVLAGGLALRLIWLARLHGIDSFLDAAEATRVALAFATSGTIADAYFPGQGPTAHLLPLSPMISGTVMRLLGPGSTGANLALLGWSLAQVGAAYLLLRILFRQLGADRWTLRWGTALLCLVPPFVSQETVDFRYWEGGMALALAALNLSFTARVDASGTMSWRMMLGAAALAAVTFFLCPPVGLATDFCWGIVALRRLPLSTAMRFAATAAVALALLVTPWAVRNARVLGEPVLLRSNFGLELAIANHPAAVSDEAPERVFADRLAAIHPAANAHARAIATAPGGEIRYAHALGDETWTWIAANPAAFAKLYLRHLGEFLFPRPWQMYFTGWEGARDARAWTISTINLLGLIGLTLGLIARRRRYWMLAVYIAAVALPYALFQPMARYIYLVWGPLAFLAVEAVATGSRSASKLFVRTEHRDTGE